MSELKSREEYASLAAALKFPSGAFIDGAFAPAASGATFDTVNPATGEVITQVAACAAADVDRAVAAARKTFEGGEWSRRHPTERKAVMARWAALIEEHADELAVMESLDSGKPINDCVVLDLPETANCLTWYGEAADKLYGEISPANNDAMGLIVREPVGVVGCVLPWNFPMQMLGWKVGPALAAGNSLVVKPAEQTSLTALRLAELAAEAGVPAGAFNVVPGLGEDAGAAIGLHPDLDVVSFTGSTEVGRLFLKYAADSNLKRIVLECGGKNPAVVLSDAADLKVVAEQAVQAVFWNMGENCTSNSRLIVHRSLKEKLVPHVMEAIKAWPCGDPLDPDNILGAIVSREQYDKIMGYIRGAKEEGAKLLLGGEPLKIGDGMFIPPTVFDEVTPEMTIAREEIFGPVLAIMTVDSDEEAIALANDTCYGLQATLFTSNVTSALRGARRLRAGTVSVNAYGEGDLSTPFGGYKLSGFGGRDNGLHAFDQYTEIKTIWIDLASGAAGEALA